MYRMWEKNGLWYWNIRASNHVVMLKCSKGHPTHREAQREIKEVSVWANTAYKPMNSIAYTDTSVMRSSFHIMGAGDMIIALSKQYKSELQCHAGSILAVRLAKSKETLLINARKYNGAT